MVLKRKRTSGKSGMKKRRKGLKKTVLSIINKHSETKWHNKASSNISVYHNGGTGRDYGILTNLLQCNQGTGQSARIGDEVNAVGVKLKIYLQNTAERKNVNYRLWVMQVPRALAGSTAFSNIFDGSIVDNGLTAMVNTDYYRIIKQKIVRMSYDTWYPEPCVLRNQSKVVTMYVKLKGRKVAYGPTNDSPFPKDDKNCYSFCVVAYDNNGALLTDHIGNVTVESRFYYKDS